MGRGGRKKERIDGRNAWIMKVKGPENESTGRFASFMEKICGYCAVIYAEHIPLRCSL
jgi:hypothetical protein